MLRIKVAEIKENEVRYMENARRRWEMSIKFITWET
jgi:hypothetical protein